MSVELYIYPQNFDDASQIPIDYLPDYEFTALNTSVATLFATEALAVLYYVPITSPFLFYRWASTALNYPTATPPPTMALLPTGGWMMRMTGLSPSQFYVAKFETVVACDPITISLYDGTSLSQTYTFPAQPAGTNLEWGFYPPNSVTTFAVSSGAGDASITTNWRVQNYVAPTLSDGQVIVDLFDEKQIPLTLSVDNFQNAAEKTQSYSKSFKLPGTKRNNKIFRNIFDITATIQTNSIDFNPYRKTPIVLQEDGATIFQGFLRMLNVDFKGQDLIYTVNLYSETIQIKDVLKNKKFYDINLDELNHAYVKSTIKSSWDNTPGLTLLNPLPAGTFAGVPGQTSTVVLKYPFCDWTHNATIASNPGAPPAPGPADGMPEFSSLGQMFRPWIQIKYLINRIFEGAGFTWTSTFFDSADFQNLFMDFNWGPGLSPLINLQVGLCKYRQSSCGGPNVIALNSAYTNIPLCGYFSWSSFSILPADYNTTTNQYISTNNFTQVNYNNYELRWENTGGTAVDILVEMVKNGGYTAADKISSTFTAGANSNGTFSMTGGFLLMAGDTMEQRWITLNPGDPQTVRLLTGSSVAVKTDITAITQNIVGSSLLMTKRGQLKQWDFLKGILTMFNLLTVADPTNNKNIIIEKYDTIFPRIGEGGGNLDLKSRGITKDWTDKIDDEKFNLKPLNKLKKQTDFLYVNDTNDYTAQNYKNAFGGFEYGSLVFDASDLTLLVGEAKVKATPFAATLNKPFDGLVPDLWCPSIYKLKDDGTTEGFDNKPRILYDNGRVTMSSGTFYIPSANGESSENATTYLQFSGFSDFPITPTSNDLNFGTCQLIGANNPTVLNLFNKYFAAYYFDLYNPDTRIVTVRIKLNSADINQFSFSDIVMIKNRAYRVNKINYNPGQLAKVELVLIP
tara:strand:+ start:445 stop:3171 length:2727 start_codon:yes stop_codon:yes gene_type:complete